MVSIKAIEWFKIPEGIRIRGIDRFYSPMLNRITLKKAMKVAANPELLRGLGNEKKEEIIVSLTSFPARLEYVYICLAQLFNQSLAPDRIILWLAEPQFPSKQLPENLTPYIEKGLEVRFCPLDIKGHKKYFYAMQENPNSLIITFDDDLIYHEDCVKELYESYKRYPKCVSCLRSQEIQMDRNGAVRPYNTWKTLSDNSKPSLFFMPSTGAGTLYPPHLLSKHTFDAELLSSICLTADDLWMKTMSLLEGIKVARVDKYHRPLTTIDGSQDVTLADENIFNSKNDECIKNLMKQFPDAFEKLKQ